MAEATSRKNGWTDEQDITIKNVLIEYAEEGKTQAAAFKQISAMLVGRSPKACKLRWERELVQRWGDELREAVRRGEQMRWREDSWEPEQDEVLIGCVLRAIQLGDTYISAYIQASERVGRTIVACKQRWLNVLLPEYRDKIEQIRLDHGIPATPNDWSPEEDEVLIGKVEEIREAGLPMQEAYVRAAAELSRSFDACKAHWTNVLGPTYDNRLDIHQEPEVIGDWMPEEDGVLVSEVFTAIKEHRTLRSAFIKANKTLKRSVEACVDRWYRHLRHRHKAEISKLKSENRVDSWEQDEKVLLDTVISAIRQGKTKTSAFEAVAKQTNRTVGAVQLRWNVSVKNKYQKEYEEACKEAERLVAGVRCP